MIARGGVRLTPGEREAIGRAVGRIVAWIGRSLGLPWWGTVLLTLGVVGAGTGLYVLRDRIADWLRQ